MEFQDVVRTRRMVRSFECRDLPAEVVARILRNAQRAPSAGFSQGWAFLVFEGQEQTQQYWDAVGPDDRDAFNWQDLFSAPLLIVCLSNKAAYLDRYAEPDKGWTDRSESHWPAPYWDIDTGMATMLILLTAVDAGLGFDAALTRVASKYQNALSVEFSKMLREVSLGRPIHIRAAKK